jgi:hypothetical protein
MPDDDRSRRKSSGGAEKALPTPIDAASLTEFSSHAEAFLRRWLTRSDAEKERAVRCLGEFLDFHRYVCQHPEILEGLPDKASVEFVDADHPPEPRELGRDEHTVIYLDKSAGYRLVKVVGRE